MNERIKAPEGVAWALLLGLTVAAACGGEPINIIVQTDDDDAGSGNSQGQGAATGGTSTASGDGTTGVAQSSSSATTSTAQSSSSVQSTSSSSQASSGSGSSGQGGEAPSAVCGNVLVEAGESCDDGNQTPGDGCDASCQLEVKQPSCGDKYLDLTEHCDDGNTQNGDGCDKNCMLEAGNQCGDAVNLNDPQQVTKSGSVSTYSGTTNASSVFAGPGGSFGDPSCDWMDGTSNKAVALHRFTASKEGFYRFETVNAGAISMDDTVLWAYRDCFDMSSEIACNDVYTQGLFLSRMYVRLQAQQTVFVAVAGQKYSLFEPGAYKLEVEQVTECGNGALEGGEECDDGNKAGGDGCDVHCSTEPTYSELEPNANHNQASKVSGLAGYGSIDPSNDEDYFAITVPQGATAIGAQLRPILDSPCGPGSTSSLGKIDSEMQLFASDGKTSLGTDDASKFCAGMLATGLTAGTYYLRIAASSMYCPGCKFSYKLNVAVQ